MEELTAHVVLNGTPLENPYVGQGTYAFRLIQGLTRRTKGGFVVVAPDTLHSKLEANALSQTFTFPTRSLPRHHLLRGIALNRRLLKVVRREFPNSVFHSPGPIAGGERPRTTVVTLHDCIYRTFPYYLGRFGIRKFYVEATERFARAASLVLTDSEFSKQDLIEKLEIADSKIEVLYPWVGEEFRQPISQDKLEEIRKRYGLPPDFWLYLGGYDYRKNVEQLLRAYAIVSSRTRVPPLVLAGKIPDQPTRVVCNVLGTLRELGLDDRKVILPGIIEASDLPLLYKAAILLIYPSLMEGFGLPPAEAIAVGTSVLASSASSLPEVVRNPYCLFDPDNIEALVSKLAEAANDPTRFKAKLREEFTEAFGIQRYVRLMNSVVVTHAF